MSVFEFRLCSCRRPGLDDDATRDSTASRRRMGYTLWDNSHGEIIDDERLDKKTSSRNRGANEKRLLQWSVVACSDDCFAIFWNTRSVWMKELQPCKIQDKARLESPRKVGWSPLRPSTSRLSPSHRWFSAGACIDKRSMHVTHVRGVNRKSRDAFQGFRDSASRPLEIQPFREAPRIAPRIREAEQKPFFRGDEQRVDRGDVSALVTRYASYAITRAAHTWNESFYTRRGPREGSRAGCRDVSRWYA